MGLFGKKRPRKRMLPIEMRKSVRLPPSRRPHMRMVSREYSLFRKAKKMHLTWYERLVRLASGIISAKPDEKTDEEMRNAIAFTGLKIRPGGVISLFYLTVILFAMLGGIFVFPSLLGFLTEGEELDMVVLSMGLGIASMGLLMGYYFLKYPLNLVKTFRIKASSQVVLAILYMVISMRVSPNLERALNYAASNVTGPLAWDMRRLLWDIEMRTYYSASEALESYIAKWKPENEEFAEALRLIKDSDKYPPDKSSEVLDESLNIILDGSRNRMKRYAQDLRMPVMVIHMMGIVLPVLGTIMTPLAAIFMSDVVGPIHFILGYDVILPIVILWFIHSTLSRRPITFSQINIRMIPGLPRRGCYRMGGGSIPVLPIAILLFLIMAAFPVTFFIQNPGLLIPPEEGPQPEHGVMTLAISLLLTLSIAFTIALYFYLTNSQRFKVQAKVQKTESQLELATFQLGNRISGGTPIELAVQDCIEDMKDLEISNLFKISLRNMRSMGMTFDRSLFDNKWGALLYFPSRLIRNIFLVVTDTARTGLRYASESMLRISKYLKNIRETQEYIREILSETASSMKFQAYFLTPMITGMIVSMSSVIILVLQYLDKFLTDMNVGEFTGLGDISMAMNMKASTSPEVFQLIVGIYMIEVVIILGIFLTKISEGDNSISQWYTTSKMLAVSLFIYFIVALISSAVFTEMVASVLQNMLLT